MEATAPSSRCKITCLCGLASQTISRPDSSESESGTSSSSPLDLELCHCRSCRKISGLLCVSYVGIEPPERTEGLVAYASSQNLERLFCGTCGCHVFRRGYGADGTAAWEVATGVIEGHLGESDAGGRSQGDDGRLSEPQYARHVNVEGTRDGGLSVYLPDIRGRKMDGASNCEKPEEDTMPEKNTEKQPVLPASCHCGTVTFHITRPTDSSSIPHRVHTDLTHPFFSTSPEQAANPEDEKWWLRRPPAASPTAAAPTRYLAGTCACRSCRLASGFEIQPWAFVPSSNIFLHGSASPLNFSALPLGVLQSYRSSPGVVHDFCGRCGASVFWRKEDNAGVVDVSAGLLDAVEGARAAGWLDWWTGRVSFAEEAGTGRWGAVAGWAEGMIASLGRGMRAWGESSLA